MSEKVNVFEAKTHLPRQLEHVPAGEGVVMAYKDKPDTTLVPLEKPEKRKLGFMKGSVDPEFFFPLPDHGILPWE